MTEAEKYSVIRNAKRAKQNLTDYLLGLNEQVTICPPPDLTPLLKELKRIGTNINQVAMKVNSGVSYVPGLDQVTENQNAIVRMLRQVLQGASWQP